MQVVQWELVCWLFSISSVVPAFACGLINLLVCCIFIVFIKNLRAIFCLSVCLLVCLCAFYLVGDFNLFFIKNYLHPFPLSPIRFNAESITFKWTVIRKLYQLFLNWKSFFHKKLATILAK